jgi:hypothetical protein
MDAACIQKWPLYCFRINSHSEDIVGTGGEREGGGEEEGEGEEVEEEEEESHRRLQ